MAQYEMHQPRHFNPIAHQPQAIENTFNLHPQERILNQYECDERCCGCGDVYTVTLTDERVIQRRENKTLCCSGERADSMLFLSDISAIQIQNQGCTGCQTCSCSSLLMCLLCFPCFLCRGCCGKQSMPVAIDGAYGSRTFNFDRNSFHQAMIDIPSAAIPRKTSRNHYIAQGPLPPPVPSVVQTGAGNNQYVRKPDDYGF